MEKRESARDFFWLLRKNLGKVKRKKKARIERGHQEELSKEIRKQIEFLTV